MKEQQVETIDLVAVDKASLFGERDANLRRIEQKFAVEATLRGHKLAVAGPNGNAARAAELIRQLIEMIKQGRSLAPHDVDYVADLIAQGNAGDTGAILNEQALNFERRTLYLKSPGQRSYVDAIRNHDVVFAIGPAGTGKTYLAVALSVLALRDRLVDRIVLVRPAVEAGESLGFLPGGFEEKVDPYLRPLYDALRDLMGQDKVKRFMETGVIEIAPLAYMRGRTLSKSFVILDEAQNTTVKQMKMFLTRLGPYSKAVITGDVTQIDLERKDLSGLVKIQGILAGVTGIEFCYFEECDVVRHQLVKQILRAFGEYEKEDEAERADDVGDDSPPVDEASPAPEAGTTKPGADLTGAGR